LTPSKRVEEVHRHSPRRSKRGGAVGKTRFECEAELSGASENSSSFGRRRRRQRLGGPEALCGKVKVPRPSDRGTSNGVVSRYSACCLLGLGARCPRKGPSVASFRRGVEVGRAWRGGIGATRSNQPRANLPHCRFGFQRSHTVSGSCDRTTLRSV